MPISAHATTSHTSHVIQKTGLKLLVTDAALLGNVLAIAGSGCSLKYVVVIGDVSSEQKNQASEANIELISFTELESQVPKEQYEPVVVGME